MRVYGVVTLVILAAVGADVVLNDGAVLTILLRKLGRLVEYLSFWR